MNLSALRTIARACRRRSAGVSAFLARPAAVVVLTGVLGVVANCSERTEAPVCESVSTAIFHDRIEPLLREGNAKTCNQCHLSGVDLKSFVRSTPCETMACLLDRGLVDLSAPPESKILSWILRAQPDSKLITEDVIRAEHDGFLEWIEANAACPSACSGATCGVPSTGASCNLGPPPNEPSLAAADSACSDKAVEQLFYDDVYQYRDRCFPCHFSSERTADPTAPRWIRNDGNCATSSVETLRMVERLGLMNLDDPPQSLLLLKPLAEVGGGVPHGGAEKFESTDDSAYLSFLDFIGHYASCKTGE